MIAVAPIPDEGLCEVLNDRLRRAAAVEGSAVRLVSPLRGVAIPS